MFGPSLTVTSLCGALLYIKLIITIVQLCNLLPVTPHSSRCPQSMRRSVTHVSYNIPYPSFLWTLNLLSNPQDTKRQGFGAGADSLEQPKQPSINARFETWNARSSYMSDSKKNVIDEECKIYDSGNVYRYYRKREILETFDVHGTVHRKCIF